MAFLLSFLHKFSPLSCSKINSSWTGFCCGRGRIICFLFHSTLQRQESTLPLTKSSLPVLGIFMAASCFLSVHCCLFAVRPFPISFSCFGKLFPHMNENLSNNKYIYMYKWVSEWVVMGDLPANNINPRQANEFIYLPTTRPSKDIILIMRHNIIFLHLHANKQQSR